MTALKDKTAKSLDQCQETLEFILNQLKASFNEIEKLKNIIDFKNDLISILNTEKIDELSKKDKTIMGLQDTLLTNEKETLLLRKEMQETINGCM